MLVDLYERGPDTLEGLLGRFSEREVDVAIRRLWLKRWFPGDHDFMWLGWVGARWFKGVGGRARSLRVLRDGFVRRCVIGWHERGGWEFVERHSSNPNAVWLRDPDGRSELLVVKADDYTDTGANDVVAANGQVVAARGGRIVLVVRDAGLARVIERRQRHMVVLREFSGVLSTATPTELKFLGGAQ